MATATRPAAPFNNAEMQRRVRHPLQSMRGTIRSYVLLEGFLVAVLYLAIGFWVSLALDFGPFFLFRWDWLLWLQETTGNTADVWLRAIILTLFLAGLVALVTYKIFLRLFREFRDSSLALVLERRFPRQLGDRLITAVELADQKQAEKYGFSPEMMHKTIEEAADRVEQVPVKRVFNWGRLWKLGILAGLATVGMYIVVMIAGMIIIGATGNENRGDSPMAFFGRFNRVVGTWFSRGALFQDKYWLRNGYVELVRFQDTPKHPGEMRLGEDEKGAWPALNVRAYKWVIRDERPARELKSLPDRKTGDMVATYVRNHYGWRPLVWSDVEKLAQSDSTLAAAATRAGGVPETWPGWTVEVDDLDPAVPQNLVPKEWQGRTFDDVRRDAAYDARMEALKRNRLDAEVQKLFKWKQWTLDRIELQVHQPRVAGALSADALAAFKEIFTLLERRALDDDNRGQVRVLEVPPAVEFVYSGKKTVSPADNTFSQIKESGVYLRKYALPLKDLTESVEFYVRAEDYYTPQRHITLVPPTSVKTLKLNLAEPAYIYHRILGDLKSLKGKKQILPEQTLPISGENTVLTVKHGSDLSFTGEVDRPLKGKVQVAAPKRRGDAKGRDKKDEDAPKADQKGPRLPATQPDMGDDSKSFSMHFQHITEPYEFVLEFNDEDNVKGRLHVHIRPKEDKAPEITQTDIKAAFRKAIAEKTSPSGEVVMVDLPIEGYLITPDAELPIKATLKDDYGLTKAAWKFEYEPKLYDLSGEAKDVAPPPIVVLEGTPRSRRLSFIATAMQFGPGHASILAGAPYISALDKILAFDVENGPQESETPVVSFANRMKELALRDPDASKLDALLKKSPEGLPEMLRVHQLNEQDYFDVAKYVPKLKVADPKQPQMHYELRLWLETYDTNVEVEKGPRKDFMRTPYVFAVISENELLYQISLEEKSIRNSLEIAEKRVNDSETGLVAFKKRIDYKDTLDPKFLEYGLGVSEDANSNLAKAFSSIRMASSAYARIANEMSYNRVRQDRLDQIVEKIMVPLQDLLLPGGEVSQAESAIFALNTRMRKDVREKLKLNDDHAALTQDAIVKVQDLGKRLNKILAEMEADISWNRSRDRLKKMKDDQEALAIKVKEVAQIELDIFLKAISGLDGKTPDKKEPEKKEPEKKEPETKKEDGKKISSLNGMSPNGHFVSQEATKSKKLFGWEASFVIITGVHRWAEAERAVWDSRAQVGTNHLPSGEWPLVLGGLGS